MSSKALPDSAFLVLALVAERETHGYDIGRLVHSRGFRLWTRLRRSAIYKALTQLEESGLVNARVTVGDGPGRRVYRASDLGLAQLRAEGVRHLSAPAHPINEIDLGVYALPFLDRAEAVEAFTVSLVNLGLRRDFLTERLGWCQERGLHLPGLAFERSLVALEAEISWLERVASHYAANGAESDDWARFTGLSRSEAGGAVSMASGGQSR